MEKIFTKAQFILLEALSEKYSNIIVVIDPTGNLRTEVYETVEFREETTVTLFNSLHTYKRITEVIDQNSTYSNSIDALGTVTTKIDSMKPIMKERKYSNQFIWLKL
jgi:hypothetical protein